MSTLTLAEEMSAVAAEARRGIEAPARTKEQKIRDEATAKATEWVNLTVIPAIRAEAGRGGTYLTCHIVRPRRRGFNLSDKVFAWTAKDLFEAEGFEVDDKWHTPFAQDGTFWIRLIVSWEQPSPG